MNQDSSFATWGVWLIRTLISMVLLAAATLVGVWAVGDRLLAHALTGITKSIESLDHQVAEVRGDIRSVGNDAVDRFFEINRETGVLKVDVTGNFEKFVGQLEATNQQLIATNERLGEFTKRVDATLVSMDDRLQELTSGVANLAGRIDVGFSSLSKSLESDAKP